VALRLDGSGSRRLLEDGSSPVYSPDGSEIALVRSTVEYLDSETRWGSDLYVMNAEGTNVRRLTHTPNVYESAPSWDPSGERLAYERLLVIGEGIGSSGPMQVNADGSCASKMFSARRSVLLMPTWQPGPGREAGGIEC